MDKEKDDTVSTKIALIDNNISYIQKDIVEIKQGFKDLSGAFITKKALEEIAVQTEKRLVKLENTSNFWKVLSPTLAAVLGSVLTFLLINFLQNSR